MTTTTHLDLLEQARTLAEGWREREREQPDDLQPESLDAARRSGLLLAPFPQALGGQGCSLVDAVHLTETIGRASPSMALLVSMPLGLAGVHSANDAVPAEHRAAWEARVEALAADYAAGVWYAACNSERGAGGSLDATKTVASRQDDGAWRLTGEKILATGGRYADRFFSTAKVTQDDLPGAGVVEFFVLRTDAPGVQILDDWDGFGMRPTESQTVRYEVAPASDIVGFPDFIAVQQPLGYWFCLFAAIPLACAASMLEQLSTPRPASPALRLRFTDAEMRVEALRAYLRETASMWQPAAGQEYAARVLRTKTYVSQESTKLCAELFALGGGRHYRRTDPLARLLADSFAGTALRPPLAMALDAMVADLP
ncbi:MAG: hypothetical protein GEU80_00030 [Dehalococcoidia bacterium]|nr:hypothetical protein [Dehalococcoidia bacterium]